MKKRAISLLLAAAMLLGMIVMPAAAAPAETATEASQAYQADVWYEANSAEELQSYLTNGALRGTRSVNVIENKDITVGIRLNADVTTKVTGESGYRAVFYVGYYSETASECIPISLVLDLNGHTITDTSSNNRLFGVYGSKLVLTNGTVIANGTYKAAGGTIFTSEYCEVTLDGVRFVSNDDYDRSGGAAATTSGGSDGGLYCATGTASKLTVINSELEKTAGVVNEGGLIASTGTTQVNITNSVLKGGKAIRGGSIYMTANASLTMTDTLVYGGEAVATTSTTANRGGNIFCMGKATLTRCTVTGGRAYQDAGNIYFQGQPTALIDCTVENGFGGATGNNIMVYDGPLTVDGGKIAGGFYADGKVTFTGAPVVSNYDYEGVELTEPATFNLTEGAKIVVAGAGSLSDGDVSAYLEAGYILPCTRTALTLTEGILTGAATDTGYCPHCEQNVTWQAYTSGTVTTGHYYAEAMTDVTPGTVAAGTDLVIDLRGKVDVTAHMVNQGNVTFISSVSGGGCLDCVAASASEDGSLLYSKGQLDIYGGTFNGATTSKRGGTVYIYSSGKMNLYNGRITGGKVASTSTSSTIYAGGNLYVGSGTVVTMKGGMIDGGASSHNDGTTAVSSGNVEIYKGTLIMDGGLILDGTATGSGGNIYAGSSTVFTMNGGIVSGGHAAKKGGNLYVAPYTAAITINDGLISSGYAGEFGGNVFANNGKFYLYGGTVTDGTAVYGGGNLYLNAGFNTVTDGALATKYTDNICVIGAKEGGQAPKILNGRAETITSTYSYSGMGGNILLTGELTLGKAEISGGYGARGLGQDLAIAKTASTNAPKLLVQSAFTGNLALACNTGSNTNALTQFNLTEYGKPIFGQFTAEAPLNGTLTYENMAGEPSVYAGEGGVLTVASGKLVDSQTGEASWSNTFADAVAAATGDQYVQLLQDETVTLTGDVRVDMNGKNLTASGTGTVYGFDSANDDYDGYGVLTGVEAAPSFLAPNGNQYITVTDAAGTSFHRLGQGVSDVVLRPGNAGIYYKATWNCDEVLAQKITTQGIALSTAHMPGADLLTDAMVLRTQRSDSAPDTSVLVQNILVSGNENNAERGTKSIYAAAYTVVNGMTIVTQDGNQEQGGVSYNLRQVLERVDLLYPGLTESQQKAVKKLYDVDPAVLETWKLPNIVGGATGTAAVRPLKILTLGHSLAVDSGHMLNLVASTEGYNQEMEIATLYYSGCPLYKHVNYIKGNSPVYDLYLSSTTTPDKAPTIMKDVTMEFAVKKEKWDIIIMQGGVFEIAYDETYTDGNIQYIQDYVNAIKTNSDAIFAWHMPWATPTDNELRDMYPKSPNSYYNSYEAFNDDRSLFYNAITGCVERNIVTDPSFIYLIPTGTAIENALSSYLVEKDLHRDYAHVSDLGRVIASYTWYCTLAGVDELEEVKLNAIPKAFLKSTADKTQDRVLTEAEKDIILEAVNNALANPLQMTQSQYTTDSTQ